jgi:hypothetical protein
VYLGLVKGKNRKMCQKKSSLTYVPLVDRLFFQACVTANKNSCFLVNQPFSNIPILKNIQIGADRKLVFAA